MQRRKEILPELVSGILGDTRNYNDMLQRSIENNVHAFAPQTINWDNPEGMGNVDPLFDYKYSEKSFEKLKKMCEDVGTGWVELIIFDGNHEFYKGDEPIKQLICDISD